MVPFKPHLTLVYNAGEVGTTQTWSATADWTFYSLVIPMTSSAAYEKFGVELNNPWVMYFEMANQSDVSFGDKVSAHDQIFIVKAKLEHWIGTGPAAHCSVLLEEFGNA